MKALVWWFLFFTVPLASAQAPGPSSHVTLLVSFTAGGSADTVARTLAPELSSLLNKPVIVNNIAGAGGALGVRKLLTSPANGSTLLFGGVSETLLIPLGNPHVGYKPEDLMAISIVGTTPMVLAVRPDLPTRDLNEFTQVAKAAPMKLSHATSGEGSHAHLMFNALSRQKGFELLHIPYKGNNQILVDLASGQIDAALTNLVAAAPFIEAHRIKPLAISSVERVPNFATVPTLLELGIANPITLWAGLFASKDLDKATAQKINAAMNQMLNNPALRQRLQRLGISVNKAASLDESQRFFADQIHQSRDVTSSLNTTE